MIQKEKKRRQYSEFEKIVKKILIDKGMTATELSIMIKTTPQYLNKIFKGERSGKKYKNRICHILGIDKIA